MCPLNLLYQINGMLFAKFKFTFKRVLSSEAPYESCFHTFVSAFFQDSCTGFKTEIQRVLVSFFFSEQIKYLKYSIAGNRSCCD